MVFTLNFLNKHKNEQTKQELFLIVGLGNIGAKYDHTKHNIGFDVLDELAKKYQISMAEKSKFDAILGEGIIENKRVLLIKPTTFMNLSGIAIKKIVNFYKVPPENFLVIYDDISLAVGMLRIREKGSHGGHNGIKNIIHEMGTDVFPRLKFGVGAKPDHWDLADYVLAPFPKEETHFIESGIEKAILTTETILKDGITSAMNQMNQKPKTIKKRKQLDEQTFADNTEKQNLNT